MLTGIEAAACGRIGRDPELKYVKGGELALLTLSVAVGGDDSADPEWIRVATFGERAEELAGQLTKGSRVYVEGKLRLERWQGNDGVPRAGLSLAATVVQQLGAIGKRRPKAQRAPAPQRTAAPAAANQAVPLDDPIPF